MNSELLNIIEEHNERVRKARGLTFVQWVLGFLLGTIIYNIGSILLGLYLLN